MFDWFKRLCGEGKFRIEGETTDGRGFVLKFSYIGCPNSELEVLGSAAGNMLVEGMRIRWMRIISFYGSGIEFNPTYEKRTEREIYSYLKG